MNKDEWVHVNANILRRKRPDEIDGPIIIEKAKIEEKVTEEKPKKKKKVAK